MTEADPIDAFIEQMGLISQADGAPRIAGRLFGLLLVEGKPLALPDIASRLAISKASASTNARLLAQRGVIRLRSRAGDRRDYYELVPDSFQHMLDMVSERMRHNAVQLAETEERLPAEYAEVKERIAGLIRFYRVSADFLEDWSSRWRRETASPGERKSAAERGRADERKSAPKRKPAIERKSAPERAPAAERKLALKRIEGAKGFE